MVYWADSHPLNSAWTTTVTARQDAVAGQAGPAHPAAGQVDVPRQATVPAGEQDLRERQSSSKIYREPVSPARLRR
jgi:hypothetical protein